jgi:hypothetical protein
MPHEWPARAGNVRTTAFPGIVQANGSNYPVPGYAFDAATAESIWFTFICDTAGTMTVDLFWYADTASSGDVIWGCQVAAITPNTDTQDIETDGLDTAATFTDSHLGTTGQRLHQCQVSVTAVDSVAVGDQVMLRVYRDAAAGGDTMSGDAILTLVKTTA